MAKRDTIGYKAQQARAKGERRVRRLQAVIESASATERVRNWARTQIKEIKSAMQGTRQYSKSGKRYKSKSDRYIQQQITRLEAATEKVAPRYRVVGDSFYVTQSELNKASVGAPSAYSKTEVQIFYRVTQRIWHREGVGEHSRNEAIMEHFNSQRAQNGLSPLSLDEIVDAVLKSNENLKKMQEMNPEELTPEQRELYEQAQAADQSDGEKGSPPGLTQVAVDAIRDALDNLTVLPDLNAAALDQISSDNVGLDLLTGVMGR